MYFLFVGTLFATLMMTIGATEQLSFSGGGAFGAVEIGILHLWTFKTPTLTLKKYKNVKSILMVLLFLLLFGW